MTTTNRRTLARTWGAISLFGATFVLFLFLALSVQVHAQSAGPQGTLPQPTSVNAALTVAKTVEEDVDWTPLHISIAITETIVAVTPPAHGQTRITPDFKDVEYKPDPNYCNAPPGTTPDSFTYTVAPGGGSTQVDVTVTCVNDAPEISAPGATQTVAQDATLIFSNANSNPIVISDVDAGGANVGAALSASHGALTVSTTAGLTVNGDGTGNVTMNGPIAAINTALNGLAYAPTAGYYGSDSLEISVNDLGATGTGGFKGASAAVAIEITPLPPAVENDSDTVDEDSSVDIDVLSNDVANSGTMDPSSVAITGTPGHGTATPLPDGKIRYTPAADYNGSDAFTYQACNTAGLCDTAMVDVTVAPVNDPPTIAPINDRTVKEGTPFTVPVRVHDIDGDPLTVTATSDNPSLIANLLVTGVGDNRTLVVTLVNNQIGRAAIRVTVDDGTAPVSTTFTVQVTAPDLNVSITDGGVSVRPGQTVAYVINYGNSNEPFISEATGVTIRIDVPDHTSFDASASASGWSCADSSPPGTTCQFSVGSLGKGEAGAITFAVKVDAGVPDSVGAIEARTAITDDGTNGDDTNLGNNSSSDATPIDRSVLLVATKRDALDPSSDNDGIAGEGDRIKYTIIIRNDGLTPALDVAFNDSPDANSTLEVGSVTTTQGTVLQGNTPGDIDVSIDVGEISPGDEMTIAFNVIINSPLPEGVTRIANQGVISGGNFATVQTDDPDTSNVNDETVTPLGAIPVISANKEDSLLTDANGDGLASPGDTLAYTITLNNAGVVDATGVVFEDGIAGHISLVVGSVTVSDPGAVIDSGNGAGDTGVNVDIGDLASGETVEIVFAVKIDSVLPDDVSQVENQGVVYSQEIPQTLTDDPDTPEKGDATKTTVVTRPILVALKSDTLSDDVDGNGEPSPGDVIEYLIAIRNDGVRASAIVLDDVLSSYVSLTRDDQNQDYVQTSRGVVLSGNNGGNRVTVSIDELGTGESVNISFKVKIAGTLPGDVLVIQNQGVVSVAELEQDVVTDDPDTTVLNDPTITPVTGEILLDATMTALMGDRDKSGGYTEGDVILYNIIVENNGNRSAPEATLEVTLDPHTVLYGDDNIPKPDPPIDLGVIPAGDRAVVGIAVQLVNVQDITEVVNQFRITYHDPDAQQDKFILTDDPNTPDLDDPNRTPIQPADARIYLPLVFARDQ